MLSINSPLSFFLSSSFFLSYFNLFIFLFFIKISTSDPSSSSSSSFSSPTSPSVSSSHTTIYSSSSSSSSSFYSSPFTEIVTMVTTIVEKNKSNSSSIDNYICNQVLFYTLPNSKINLLDLLIIIPHVIFSLYFLFKFYYIIIILKRFKRHIFTALFILVLISEGSSLLRCIISLSIYNYYIINKLLWIIVRFFLLTCEFSVLTFAVFFGHLDSKTSVRRIFFVTFLITFLYSSIQTLLELLYNNNLINNINTGNHGYSLFGHGGMLFLFLTSLFLFLVYFNILFLPYTNCASKIALPTKKSFYIYCFILSLLNFTQSFAAILFFSGISPALCVIDLTVYLYYSFFSPLVYFFFLHSYVSSHSFPSLMFLYRPQVEYNEEEDDDDDELLRPGEEGDEEEEEGFRNNNFFSIKNRVSINQSEALLGDDLNILNNEIVDSFSNSSLGFNPNLLFPTLSSQPDLTLSNSHDSFIKNKKKNYFNFLKRFPV